MQTRELIDEAIQIIIDEIKTSKEVKRLEAIKAQLTRKYAKNLLEGAAQERLYNMVRPQMFLKFKKERVGDKLCTVAQAEQQAKEIAEEKYGDYEIMKAKAKWYKAIIDTIGTAIISFQSERKWEWQTGYSATQE